FSMVRKNTGSVRFPSCGAVAQRSEGDGYRAPVPTGSADILSAAGRQARSAGFEATREFLRRVRAENAPVFTLLPAERAWRPAADRMSADPVGTGARYPSPSGSAGQQPLTGGTYRRRN